MKSFTKFKKEMLKDKDIREAYNNLGPEFALMAALIEKRLERGLTQKELAKKIGTKQSAIARLESGNYNPTVELLEKVAKALKAKLTISIS